MAKLSIKRNRSAVKRMLSEYKLERRILAPKPAPEPEPGSYARPLRVREDIVHHYEGKVGTNADIFASQGNTWGALRPMEHEGDLKITAHPDGFIHVTFRHLPEDDEYVPVVLPPREPDPVRKRAPLASLRRKVHALGLAQAHAARSRSVVCA